MFQSLGPLLSLLGGGSLTKLLLFLLKGLLPETDGLKGEYHADRIGASAGSDQPARYVVDHRRALAVM